MAQHGDLQVPIIDAHADDQAKQAAQDPIQDEREHERSLTDSQASQQRRMSMGRSNLFTPQANGSPGQTDESQAHSDESANQGTLARMNASKHVRQIFVIARNPEEDSKLPFLLRLPLQGGLVLKARDTWPRSARIYCHPFEGGWPQGAEILEETPIVSCRRRGALIDLVLDRPRLARSQFVFTETRGRATIFWQTQKAARAANPGARVPRARAAVQGLAIAIDTRERYPFRFAGRGVETERVALPAGDYAVRSADALIAAVERKASRISFPASPTVRSPSRCNVFPSFR